MGEGVDMTGAYGRAWWRRGQSSVEYALVLLAFLGAILVLALLWRVAAAGGLVSVSQSAASHSGDGLVGLSRDVLLY